MFDCSKESEEQRQTDTRTDTEGDSKFAKQDLYQSIQELLSQFRD